jgi:DNA-binding winged helix-turn-helix (wHTH) protein
MSASREADTSVSRDWRFSGFVYSTSRGLERDGVAIDLQPKVRGLLELLLDRGGRIVAKSEIGDALWPDEDVSDNSIARCISLLRKTLHAHGGRSLLKTVYGQGVRLTVDVDVAARKPEKAVSPDREAANELLRTASEIASSRTLPAMELAQATLDTLTERHPDFLPAWALSADFVVSRVVRGFLSPAEAASRVRAATDRSLAIEPDHSPSLAVRGWALAVLEGRLEEGWTLLQASSPNTSRRWLTTFYQAWVAAARGDLEHAVVLLNTALEYSPLERAALAMRCWLTLCAGRAREAEKLAISGLEVRPDLGVLFLARSMIADHVAEFEKAVEYAQQACRIAPHDAFSLAALSYVQARAEQLAEARATLSKAHRQKPSAPPAMLAAARLALGDHTGAANMLRTAQRTHCPWASLAWLDPRLAALRPTPAVSERPDMKKRGA